MSEIGKTIGSLAGAAIGTAIAPGIGTSIGGSLGGAIGGSIGGDNGGNSTGGGGIGSILGGGAAGGAAGGVNKNNNQNALNLSTQSLVPLGLSAIQGIKALAQKNKAEGMFPSQEDPELRALATDFKRRKRAFQTGTALNSQQAMIQGMNKQAINSAFNSGAGMAGINRLAQVTNQALTGLQNNALQGEMAYANQEANVINRLAQTRLEKSLLKYNQAMAEAAQTKTNANRNFMQGLGRVVPMQQVDPMYSSAEWNIGNQQKKSSGGTDSYDPYYNNPNYESTSDAIGG